MSAIPADFAARTPEPRKLVRFITEVPRWGFVKRELHRHRRIEFISPVPSPFNYGYLPDYLGTDGDPADAIVLGPRLPLGSCHRLPVLGLVNFRDDGSADPKWVLSQSPVSTGQRLGITLFFRFYARCKSIVKLGGSAHGTTDFLGLELY